MESRVLAWGGVGDGPAVVIEASSADESGAEIKSPEVMLNLFVSASSSL